MVAALIPLASLLLEKADLLQLAGNLEVSPSPGQREWDYCRIRYPKFGGVRNLSHDLPSWVHLPHSSRRNYQEERRRDRRY